MSSSPNVFANLGAEEGASWRTAREVPEVRAAAALFESLLEPPAPFPWLAERDRLHAWLNTPEAQQVAGERGLVLAGAAPEVVAAVHDKAFAHAVAIQEGLHPRELADSIEVFEPEELGDPDESLRRIHAAIEGWPQWLGGRFTLKPRFGSSGRGRVGGTLAGLDPAALRGALPRMAERGGAILEPWLERSADLSAQLHIEPDGSLTLLGTARLEVAPSGRYLGHRGTLDSRGRVTSGTRWDESLREAAVAVALAASSRGLRGPCGVDGFAFRIEGQGGHEAREVLRPVVELNARFTMGTVAIGLLRRALPEVKSTLGLSPGQLLSFHFAPTAPPDGWPEPTEGTLHLPLAAPSAALHIHTPKPRH